MIESIEILKAVRAQLKTVWPNTDVNLDDVQRAFRLPCFFLRLNETCLPQMYYSRSMVRSCTLHIDYMIQKNAADAVNLYEVRDRIKALFVFGLKARNRFFHFDAITVQISGRDADILSVTLPFSFYDTIPDDGPEPAKMGGIAHQVVLKE